MKTFKILSGLAMGLAFASCSSDDLADNGTIAAVDEVRFLKVALCNPGSGPANRALSGDDKYETGTDAENTVQEVRFVFYDKNGERVSNVVSIQGNNLEWNNGAGQTVEKFVKAVVPVSISKGQEMPAYVMCFVNPNSEDAIFEGTTLEGWRNVKRENLMNGNDNFYMVNSAYYGHDPIKNVTTKMSGTPITLEQLYTSQAEAENPSSSTIDIYVERFAARVDFEIKDKSGNSSIADYEGVEGYTLKFIPEAWRVNADEPEMYVVKKFAKDGDSGVPTESELNGQLGSWWNDAANYRSYWACSPAYYAKDYPRVSDDIEDKAVALGKAGAGEPPYQRQYYSYDQVVKDGVKINWENTTSYSGKQYVRENTVHTDGLHSLNPRAAAPSVVLVGHYEVIDNATQQALTDKTFYLFGKNNGKYNLYKSEEDLMAKMLSSQTVLATDNQGTFLKDANSYNNLFEVKHPDKATRDEVGGQLVAGRFVTLQINKEQLANSATVYCHMGAEGWVAVTADNVDAVNAQLMQGLGFATAYEDGMAYFSIPIKHLGYHLNDTNPNADLSTTDSDFDWKKTRTGDFGIVRNHVYQINVNSITGLATGLPTRTTPIVPPMGEDEYYISYKLNILQWAVVRSQDVDL